MNLFFMLEQKKLIIKFGFQSLKPSNFKSSSGDQGYLFIEFMHSNDIGYSPVTL